MQGFSACSPTLSFGQGQCNVPKLNRRSEEGLTSGVETGTQLVLTGVALGSRVCGWHEPLELLRAD